MRLWIIAAAAFFPLASCQREQSKNNSESKIVEEASASFTSDADFQNIKATDIDSIFDDFLFSFATDSQTQRERIHFPLPLTRENGETENINSSDWYIEKLFSQEDLYTILFNTEEELDNPSKTDIREGTFEWINPKEGTIKQFNFKRNVHQAWMLSNIRLSTVSESCNADFLVFYQQFVTDETFQRRHILKLIEFVTNFTDGNDGFTSDSFAVGIDQWLAWEVPMPLGYLTNIIYGPTCEDKEPYLKILCLRAMDGAYFKALYFRKTGNTWRLYKYEDTAY